MFSKIKNIYVALLCMGMVYDVSTSNAKDYTIVKFDKLQLSNQFHAEGAGVGDFNHDGKPDVVIGSQWYAGPDFKKAHAFRSVKTFDPADYSDAFCLYGMDFNQDGWDDILVIDIPGKPAAWYENPQGKEGDWKRTEVYPWVGNESPDLMDVVGDNRPELIFNIEGHLGYATPDWEHPYQPWTFHKVSHAKGAFFVYTHGVGVGDINGDGRKDFVEALGWWEQPESLAGDPVWKFHKFPFADGAAQMIVTDLTSDGMNDIITVWHPHKYGLVWWEQVRKEDGTIDFKKHILTGEKESDSPYGVKFTQAHSLVLADIDGDGLQDIVTGKRWWAHKPPIDPEGDAPAVLYWWKQVRNADGTTDFIPFLIDQDSGVGTQFTVRDVNGDSTPDIVIGNKKGDFIFLSRREKATQKEWESTCPVKSKTNSN